MSTKTKTLTSLGPLQQLRAGRLGRRIPQLLVGLVLYGMSLSLVVRAALGLEPWGVLTQGLTLTFPFSYGAITTVVAVLVLALWIPLRQRPGVGTVLNVAIVGAAIDLGLFVVPAVEELSVRVALLFVGVIGNGLAGAIYVGAQLGPGPRDGLMTGLHHRTGLSLRLVRTGIEVVVLSLGWLLGGQVFLGTLLYAVAIGPVTQFFLRWTLVPLPGDSERF
ncbi:YitT family protein [Naumannella halotolerans]|uniref:Putative membrane protein YczE n=1 Tax=Naumannella halotolerans TaxID=993414 RepID=A0A4V3ENJ5_9ACTN|nr:hypothetical protein [Naumannella halotolerans]TDT33968.1 putative membrane protein YczE [Naumannella halotolerans]